MNAYPEKQHYTADDLAAIIAILRDPDNGCPWDKVQTHRSIRMNFLEEAYEAVDAIDLDDPELLCEELGDVLFAAVKAARFAGVDPEDALHRACDKYQGRFRRVAAAADRPLNAYTEAEKIALWEQAKEN